MVDLEVERLSEEVPSKDELILVLHSFWKGQKVVVRGYLDGLRAGMEVTLEPLECQDQCQCFLLNYGVAELVSLELGREVTDWV